MYVFLLLTTAGFWFSTAAWGVMAPVILMCLPHWCTGVWVMYRVNQFSHSELSTAWKSPKWFTIFFGQEGRGKGITFTDTKDVLTFFASLNPYGDNATEYCCENTGLSTSSTSMWHDSVRLIFFSNWWFFYFKKLPQMTKVWHYRHRSACIWLSCLQSRTVLSRSSFFFWCTEKKSLFLKTCRNLQFLTTSTQQLPF